MMMTDYDKALEITRRLMELTGAGDPTGDQVTVQAVELVGPKGYIHGWIYVGTGTQTAEKLHVGSYIGDHGRIRQITDISPSKSWPPNESYKDYSYRHIDPATGRGTGESGVATMHDFEEVQHLQPDEQMARNIKHGWTIREAQAAQDYLPEGEDLGGASAATIRRAIRDKEQADAVARHEQYGPPRPKPGTGIRPPPRPPQEIGSVMHPLSMWGGTPFEAADERPMGKLTPAGQLKPGMQVVHAGRLWNVDKAGPAPGNPVMRQLRLTNAAKPSEVMHIAGHPERGQMRVPTRSKTQIRAELRQQQAKYAAGRLANIRMNAQGKGYEPYLPQGVTIDTASETQILNAAKAAAEHKPGSPVVQSKYLRKGDIVITSTGMPKEVKSVTNDQNILVHPRPTGVGGDWKVKGTESYSAADLRHPTESEAAAIAAMRRPAPSAASLRARQHRERAAKVAPSGGSTVSGQIKRGQYVKLHNGTYRVHSVRKAPGDPSLLQFDLRHPDNPSQGTRIIQHPTRSAMTVVPKPAPGTTKLPTPNKVSGGPWQLRGGVAKPARQSAKQVEMHGKAGPGEQIIHGVPISTAASRIAAMIQDAQTTGDIPKGVKTFERAANYLHENNLMRGGGIPAYTEIGGPELDPAEGKAVEAAVNKILAGRGRPRSRPKA